MISNQEYLIQKYAEAREKMHDANTESARQYWRGSMDTLHNLLNTAFEGWAARGSVGYYVFMEQMTYDEALDQVTGTLVDC
jgi:hypothetical protein